MANVISHEETLEFFAGVDVGDKPNVTVDELATHEHNLEEAASWLDTLPAQHWKAMFNHEVEWEGPLTSRVVYAGMDNSYNYSFRMIAAGEFHQVKKYLDGEIPRHSIKSASENIVYHYQAYLVLKPQINDDSKPDGMLSIDELDPLEVAAQKFMDTL